MLHAKVNITTHPAAFLMQQWQGFIHGADRVLAFYEEAQNKAIEGLEWNQQMHGIISPLSISEEARQKLSSLFKDKTAYQWLRPDLLPFMNQERLSISQLDLFSESHYLVLLVRTSSHASTILSYLFFRNDCSNFGISDGRRQLDTSHKAIIGKMASQFASIVLRNYFDAQQQSESFRQQTKSILSASQLDSNRYKTDLNNWKNNWLDTYLSDLSKRDGLNYVISEDAREKLMSSKLDYEHCKLTIDNCIDYICKLQGVTPGDEVLLEGAYLVLPQQLNAQTPFVSEPVQRPNKVILLLDRLEDAAIALQQQGLAITSAEVGAQMPKPITAPAISDALRKHRVRILHLLEQYPERWNTIRQYFKPIINLKNKKYGFLNASG